MLLKELTMKEKKKLTNAEKRSKTKARRDYNKYPSNQTKE